MHDGKIVDAVIKAILDTADGLKYQVNFGKDQTATIWRYPIIAGNFRYFELRSEYKKLFPSATLLQKADKVKLIASGIFPSTCFEPLMAVNICAPATHPNGKVA